MKRRTGASARAADNLATTPARFMRPFAAVGLEPGWSEAALALAWSLATHPDALVRDSARALELAEQARAALGDGDIRATDTLAAAYAAGGQFERAVALVETAIAVADEVAAIELGEQLRSRLALYRQGTPYQERVVSERLAAPPPTSGRE